MDVKTGALDRVFEALAPAVASELDRAVRETREALEREYQARLDAATREAEGAKSAAEAQLGRALEDAKEETRRQVTTELDQQFSQKLETTVQQLRSEASEERAKLERQLEQWKMFAEAQRSLVEASSQPDILARFLRLAEPFAEGLAVYVRKADGLALWKSKGKGAFPDIVSKDTTDPEFYFRTISIRGNTVGAICAAPTFRTDALDFLVASLEHAIEAFGLRVRAPLPRMATP
jgi:hypothetical protein